MGEEFQDLGWHRHTGTGALRLQDRDPQFVGGRMQVGDHAAAKPGAQAVLQPVQVGRRLVSRNDDLLTLLH